MLYPDFEEFIESLNAHGVRYLIAGGHALADRAQARVRDVGSILRIAV